MLEPFGYGFYNTREEFVEALKKIDSGGRRMTKTIEMKICDVCKKEVKDFAGTLELKYSDCDYTGCGFPAGVVRKDICIDCCRKLDKAVMGVLSEEVE